MANTLAGEYDLGSGKRVAKRAVTRAPCFLGLLFSILYSVLSLSLCSILENSFFYKLGYHLLNALSQCRDELDAVQSAVRSEPSVYRYNIALCFLFYSKSVNSK